MPTKTGVLIQTSTNSQASMRAPRVFYDQHRLSKFADLPGRPWWTFVEQPADGMNLPFPCTSLAAGGRHEDGRDLHWEAPFYPDMKYADFSRTQYGQFKWAYGIMRSDDQTQMDRFYKAASRIAIKAGWAIPRPGDPLSFELAAVLGDEEPRSPLIAQALMAGNPWLIGEKLEPDDDLLPDLIRRLNRQIVWKPVVKPAEVLEMPDRDLQAIVAEAVAKAMAQRDQEEKARRAEKAARFKGKRKQVQPVVGTA